MGIIALHYFKRSLVGVRSGGFGVPRRICFPGKCKSKVEYSKYCAGGVSLPTI